MSRRKRTKRVAPPNPVVFPPVVLMNPKIFISWSGERSKMIAVELKKILENIIFSGTGLECFVSDVSIVSGEDWWNTIKDALKNCNMGIVCITKENIKAPWIYFESGALVARDLQLKPLLINCSMRSLEGTPIANKHMVDFYEYEKFVAMIHSINKALHLRDTDSSILNDAIKAGYNSMKEALSKELSELKNMRIFNEQYVYPQCVRTVNIKTLYICASMSALSAEEYRELRNFVVDLKPLLIEKCGFTSVESPLFDIEDIDGFDGKKKAIRENFRRMKQVDSMLVIYPKSVASSVLVEIGYGLALCKNTVIFHKDKLPYILDKAGTNINHIDTRFFSEYEDIRRDIERNGSCLFDMDEGEI